MSSLKLEPKWVASLLPLRWPENAPINSLRFVFLGPASHSPTNRCAPKDVSSSPNQENYSLQPPSLPSFIDLWNPIVVACAPAPSTTPWKWNTLAPHACTFLYTWGEPARSASRTVRGRTRPAIGPAAAKRVKRSCNTNESLRQ